MKLPPSTAQFGTRSGFNFFLIAPTPKTLRNQIPVKSQSTFQGETVHRKNPELIAGSWCFTQADLGDVRPLSSAHPTGPAGH